MDIARTSAEKANAAVLAAAVDAGPAAILVTDRDTRFVAANRAACHILGYSLAELLELAIADIAVEAGAAELMQAGLIHGTERRGLAPVKSSNGSTILVRYFAREVGDGRHYVTIFVPRRVIHPEASAQVDAARRPRSRDRRTLSTREFEILALLAEGMENDEIARSLHLAPDTVKAHVSKVLQKLGARSRTHAVVLALRDGLID